MDKKVSIVYDGTGKEPWDISYFRELFENKGMDVALFDANVLDDKHAAFCKKRAERIGEIEQMVQEGYGIWINRVYPSEADRSTINKSLNITSWLTKRGIETINPLEACIADYDKYVAYQKMIYAGIPTPYTKRVDPSTSIEQTLKSFGLPLILKRNTGGKGNGVIKVDTRKELSDLMHSPEILQKDYLIQKFVESSQDHDIRVGVLGNETPISYGRTLVKQGGGVAWMGSCNHGSEIIPYHASENECRVAILASKAIQANLNEVDIQVTERGPIVIENNPTPGYDPGEEHWVKLIVDHIHQKYS